MAKKVCECGKQTYECQGGRGGLDELGDGIDIYTLLILCIKWITSENLLCSSRNSTQCSVGT